MWQRVSRAEHGLVTENLMGLHMSLLEVLVLLGAVALVVVRWLPPDVRPRVTIAAAAVFVLSAIVLSVVGTRWQMLPVLTGAALALPFALSPLLRRRTGRPAWRAQWWLALPGSVACAGLIATGPVAAWAFPVPVFPEPSGRFAVGTRVTQWTDPHRPEHFTADPHDRRTAVVQLGYPAQKSPAGARRAQYLGRTEHEARTVADALARQVGLPGFLIDGTPRARTRSVFNAPVADGGGRFPVVLFSPGSGGVRTQNTAWAEELASHGYLVAALDHPYDSAAVVLTDGRTLHTKTTSTGDRDKDDKLAADWTAVRSADLSFVLTQLDRLGRGEIAGPLTGRLDTSRAAVTGHSMGEPPPCRQPGGTTGSTPSSIWTATPTAPSRPPSASRRSRSPRPSPPRPTGGTCPASPGPSSATPRRATGSPSTAPPTSPSWTAPCTCRPCPR